MRHRQSGYALLVVLLLAALVLIGLSVAVPRLLTQGQRELEEELIFRGEQYQRALGRFYRKFNRYPNTLEELLRINDRSFLRRPFPDPMTPDGKWRLIRVGAAGQFIGSVNNPLPPGLRGGTPSPPKTEKERPAETPPLLPEDSSGASSGPLVGVASRSTARAIKVYNGYSRYHQWEFIYDPTKEALGVRTGVPAPTTPTPPAQPGPRR